MMSEELRQAVERAAARPEVRRAVGEIYARLQREIDQRRPVCVASGRCCRFEEYGHRLFVTTAELATFVFEFSQRGQSIDEFTSAWDGVGCPFQSGKLCGVHAIRPFGCRVFFCDATAAEWQREQYEQFHAELKAQHDKLGVPYFYVEWRAALRALSGDRPAGSSAAGLQKD